MIILSLCQISGEVLGIRCYRRFEDTLLPSGVVGTLTLLRPGTAWAFVLLACAYFYSWRRMLVTGKKEKILSLLFGLLFLTAVFRGWLGMACPDQIHSKWKGESVLLEGRLMDTTGMGFEAAKQAVVEVISINGEKTAGRILVQVGLAGMEYGEHVRIRGRMDEPEGLRNPGGFDYRMFLRQKGISSLFYIEGKPLRIPAGDRSVRRWIMRIIIHARIKVKQSLQELFAGPAGELMESMITGSSRNSENYKKVKKDFQDTGLSHIIAVSGSHISLIVLPVSWLLAYLGIRRFWVNSALITFLFGYLAMIGFPASATRAVLSAVVSLIGQLLRKDPDFLTSLSLASILLLLLNPLSLTDPGFQLSFAATAGIFLFSGSAFYLGMRLGLSRAAAKMMALPAAVQAGTMPVSLGWFGRYSLVSIPINLLVMPFVTLAMGAGFSACILWQIWPPLSTLPAAAASACAQLLIRMSEIFSDSPVSTVNTGVPDFFYLTGAAVISLFLFRKAKKGFFFKITAMVLLLLLPLLPGISRTLFPYRTTTVCFLDVGHGDAAVIITAGGRVLLVDGGDEGKGGQVVLPCLTAMGINCIDLALVTHFHQDHLAGVLEIAESIHIEMIGVPAGSSYFSEYREKLQAAAEQVVVFSSGDVVRADPRTQIIFLHPDADPQRAETGTQSGGTLNPNNESLVFLLKADDSTVLFTGDIEKDVEAELYDQIRQMGGADVLKVSHHGSDTSSSAEFVQSVSPKMSIISTGKGSKCILSGSVTERLAEAGSVIYRTDRQGAVTLKLKGNLPAAMKMIP